MQPKNEYPDDEGQSNDTSIRSATKFALQLPFWLAVCACLSSGVKISPDVQHGGAVSVAAKAPLPSFDYLLLGLPKDVRSRIEELRARGFHQERPFCTNDPYLLGLDKTTRDCFGTVFWVVSGDAEESPIKGAQLVSKLIELGYEEEIRFDSYMEVDTQGVPPPNIEAMSQHLVPGDVLIFMSPPLWDNRRLARLMPLERHHAALYLGAVDDHHVIFQKPDTNDGPGSPYEITTIQRLLDENLSPLLNETIAVWRRRLSL